MTEEVFEYRRKKCTIPNFTSAITSVSFLFYHILDEDFLFIIITIFPKAIKEVFLLKIRGSCNEKTNEKKRNEPANELFDELDGLRQNF